MEREQEVIGHNDRLVELRRSSICKLSAYMDEPEERILHQHQKDVVESLRDFFENGQTAGYVSLPTGSGKTVLISELAQVLGLKAVVVSPTQQILEQTGRTFKRFAPGVSVSNYYARSKDLSGEIVNTTYQSLPSLIENGEIKPEEVELLICDEAHTALGEKRHILFREFPNALIIGLTATPYFTPIDGFVRRGIVQKEERWVGMFQNKIHEMTLEEAIEREVLSPLDVHLVKTGVSVDNVQVASTGEYDKGQIDKFLNNEARNLLTIGMIAGVDKVPGQVKISEEQHKEIDLVHNKIKGKRMVVFGLSIRQIEELTGRLKEIGIAAEVVHAKVDPKRREEVLKAHSMGDVQVVLGVDMLRLGWDSPETEVGIYLAPTQSGIVATQELGRILRPSPASGKEKAIAVQFVDTFEKSIQKPILIPNLFDPYYVLRGTQQGTAPSRSERHAGKEYPMVTFSGMNIQTIIDEARTSEMLGRRFIGASIEEMNLVLDELATQIINENPDIRPFAFYQLIAEALPLRIPSQAQETALQAIASIDSNKAEQGVRALLFLYTKSILSAIEVYLGNDDEENDDLVQTAVVYTLSSLKKPAPTAPVPTQVNHSAKRGAIEFVASKMNLPISWIDQDKKYQAIKKLEWQILQIPRPISGKRVSKLAEKASAQTGVSREELEKWIIYRNSLSYLEPGDENKARQDDTTLLGAAKNERDDVILQMLNKLGQRERELLLKCFGLFGESKLTHAELAVDLKVRRQRIWQLERATIKSLRHPRYSRRLRDYLDDLEEILVPAPERPSTLYQPSQPDSSAPLRARYADQLIQLQPKTVWGRWANEHPLPLDADLRDEIARYVQFHREVIGTSVRFVQADTGRGIEQKEENDEVKKLWQVAFGWESVRQKAFESPFKPEIYSLEIEGKPVFVRTGVPFVDFLKHLNETRPGELKVAAKSEEVTEFSSKLLSDISPKPSVLYTDGVLGGQSGFGGAIEESNYIGWITAEPVDELETNVFLKTKFKRMQINQFLKEIGCTTMIVNFA